MILPIVAYGDPVLRREADDIDKDYPYIKELIDNMFETMYEAHGVGLAAPQIGKSIRLFVIDASPFAQDAASDEERAQLESFKRVFINAEIVEESDDEWGFSEGCLSIPGVNEEVFRPETIVMRYMDENFVEHEETFTGLASRVIQHEYDHIDGILFTDHVSGLKKRLIQNKLKRITKGKSDADYPMRYANQR